MIYIFEAEVVAIKFEVDQGVVSHEAVNEHAANALVETVVTEVQTQKRRVGRQSINHLFNARVLFAIMGEII